MLKILQARFQNYVNWELLDVQAGFRKGKGIRDQIANIRWIIEKVREFQKKTYFCFIDYAKAFDFVDHNKPWKILRQMGVPDNFTCLLRNLYVGEGVTVRTVHGTLDWFQIRKGVHQGCILSPCLSNLDAKYITRCTLSGGMKHKLESRLLGEISITSVCRWHHPYGESEEELKYLLMKVKEESEKVGLKLNIKKTKIMASGPITSWQIDGETVETRTDFIWGGGGWGVLQNGDCSHEIKRHLEEKLWPT